MQPARAFDVFISYSTDDLEYARLVRRAVENLGFRAFLAETSLAAGERLQVIRNHLQRSKLLVLLWSESASKSEWVRDEVGAAWGANVPVIPVLLTSGLELPPSLRTSGVKYQNAVSKDSASLLPVRNRFEPSNPALTHHVGLNLLFNRLGAIKNAVGGSSAFVAGLGPRRMPPANHPARGVQILRPALSTR